MSDSIHSRLLTHAEVRYSCHVVKPRTFRVEMVLTMVYNTELLGFWSFSIVRYSREHDVSETGSGRSD
jgi:hypothetical protein